MNRRPHWPALGIDVDARMAKSARQHGLEVETFEDWDPAGRRLDAVAAGQTRKASAAVASPRIPGCGVVDHAAADLLLRRKATSDLLAADRGDGGPSGAGGASAL